MLEYQKQQEKEMKDGVLIRTDNVRVFNLTFLVPKSNWKQRKILDYRKINNYTRMNKFKMEGSQFIKQIIEKADFATTLNLEEAYQHTKVSDNILSYFGFAFKGMTYCYRGLPYRFKNSPFKFNKTLVMALREIRRRFKIKISNYIDDIIVLHKDKSILKNVTLLVMQFLQDQGWKLQMKKCRIYPSTVFTYLGWKQSTQNMEVKMPRDRRHKMKEKLLEWIIAAHNYQIVKARDLASLVGDQNFFRFQFVEASLILNSMNHLLAQATKKAGWNCLVKLNKRILGNLYSQLHKIIENNPRNTNDISPTALFTTDAAEIGWGATLQSIRWNLMDAEQ
ncbi:MAG: hypothetical protein EZS28_011785 [Streblomastix strix]|uniref:Reverse transcriptase domain-containing protein n=1 Tax=Streblomastix strix TaxID=222440 RepID=A0A5J4WCX0_9EUKA|nr:MAG: hypothetical protein EZS28_011785 [Streblomastix strix]